MEFKKKLSLAVIELLTKLIDNDLLVQIRREYKDENADRQQINCQCFVNEAANKREIATKQPYGLRNDEKQAGVSDNVLVNFAITLAGELNDISVDFSIGEVWKIVIEMKI